MLNVNTSSCIGHLKSDLASDIVEWIHNNNYDGIYAEVAAIHGGTKTKPTLGCVIELMTY